MPEVDIRHETELQRWFVNISLTKSPVYSRGINYPLYWFTAKWTLISLLIWTMENHFISVHIWCNKKATGWETRFALFIRVPNSDNQYAKHFGPRFESFANHRSNIPPKQCGFLCSEAEQRDCRPSFVGSLFSRHQTVSDAEQTCRKCRRPDFTVASYGQRGENTVGATGLR